MLFDKPIELLIEVVDVLDYCLDDVSFFLMIFIDKRDEFGKDQCEVIGFEDYFL